MFTQVKKIGDTLFCMAIIVGGLAQQKDPATVFALTNTTGSAKVYYAAGNSITFNPGGIIKPRKWWFGKCFYILYLDVINFLLTIKTSFK